MSNDETVRLEILEKLNKTFPQTNTLRVGVIGGIAHIGGKLSDRAEWDLAEAITGSVFGVCGVVNRIEAPGSPPPGRKIDLNLNKTDVQGQVEDNLGE